MANGSGKHSYSGIVVAAQGAYTAQHGDRLIVPIGIAFIKFHNIA